MSVSSINESDGLTQWLLQKLRAQSATVSADDPAASTAGAGVPLPTAADPPGSALQNQPAASSTQNASSVISAYV